MIIDIDPKVDYAFKHLFGREATRPLLIDVIDSVLNPAPGHHIRELDLLNPFNPKEKLDDKLSILDIKARDESGRQFNIEMQMLRFPHKGADELTHRLDVWLYFLRHADTMDTDALPAALAHDRLVLWALEELKMLRQTDQERERYEARRKAQLDYNTLMRVARTEGRAEGRREEKVGIIQFCERLLKRPPTPSEQLDSQSLEELTRLAGELQALLLKQS